MNRDCSKTPKHDTGKTGCTESRLGGVEKAKLCNDLNVGRLMRLTVTGGIKKEEEKQTN